MFRSCPPEITVKDEDVFKDDLVGEAEPIELDDLAVDTEIMKTVTVNEVGMSEFPSARLIWRGSTSRVFSCVFSFVENKSSGEIVAEMGVSINICCFTTLSFQQCSKCVI